MRALTASAVGRGVGLVEVMVALVVLSVGMLGVALLVTHTLRSSRSALWRTQAVILVSDMADRIRANAAGRAAYDLAVYGSGPVEQACAPDDDGAGRNCSPDELAEDDIARWVSLVRQLLPATAAGLATAEVRYLAAVPDRYRVTVAWQEPGESAPFSYAAEIQLESGS